MTDNSDDLKGLGGWLILVGLGVVLGPFRIAVEIGPLFYEILTDGSYELLTTPGSEAYHPMWEPLLIFEIVYNASIILASCYLAFLYFTKHYLFPKVYIALVLFSLVFIPLDAWLASFVLTDEPMFDPETAKEFYRALALAVIWVPYMLRSQRVKATFVENMPDKPSQQGVSDADEAILDVNHTDT